MMQTDEIEAFISNHRRQIAGLAREMCVEKQDAFQSAWVLLLDSEVMAQFNPARASLITFLCSARGGRLREALRPQHAGHGTGGEEDEEGMPVREVVAEAIEELPVSKSKTTGDAALEAVIDDITEHGANALVQLPGEKSRKSGRTGRARLKNSIEHFQRGDLFLGWIRK
jgi:hypothetical protein